jgi:Cupredoxin-like domain
VVANLLVAFAMLVSVGMTACGQSGPEATCEPRGTELVIAVLASASHHFTTDCLAAPARQAFTIYFDNQDTSSHGNHNIHISELPDPPGDFVGERAFHGTDIMYKVGPLPVGTFEFHCDEHLTMNGTFIVGGASTTAASATS